MSEHVHVSLDAGVVEVVVDRPAKKNALTGDMYAALAAAIEQATEDPAVRSILVTSTGDTFSGGNDLQDFLAGAPGLDSPVVRFLTALATTDVPLVFAVQGPAVGVGATMLLHAEHVVAAETATLQYPFVSMALVPEAGSSLLLPRVTGYLRAAEVMLTGQPVTATRALDLGLVSRVVPAGEEGAAAREFTALLAKQPPAAVRLTKRLLRDDTAGLQGRMRSEFELFVQRLQSPEFVEAVSAFMQKREPDFDALTGP
jgi:enoyl-CoA hydratase/carnithine racemase